MVFLNDQVVDRITTQYHHPKYDLMSEVLTHDWQRYAGLLPCVLRPAPGACPPIAPSTQSKQLYNNNKQQTSAALLCLAWR